MQERRPTIRNRKGVLSRTLTKCQTKGTANVWFALLFILWATYRLLVTLWRRFLVRSFHWRRRPIRTAIVEFLYRSEGRGMLALDLAVVPTYVVPVWCQALYAMTGYRRIFCKQKYYYETMTENVIQNCTMLPLWKSHSHMGLVIQYLFSWQTSQSLARCQLHTTGADLPSIIIQSFW